MFVFVFLRTLCIGFAVLELPTLEGFEWGLDARGEVGVEGQEGDETIELGVDGRKLASKNTFSPPQVLLLLLLIVFGAVKGVVGDMTELVLDVVVARELLSNAGFMIRLLELVCSSIRH